MIDAFPRARIGVLGDLMVDRFIYGSAQRLSPEAPVPVVRIRERTIQPGGAANVGSNVLSLGGQLRLFGVLGDDEDGHTISAMLSGTGADVSGVLHLPHRPSTVKTRVIAQSQQVLRYDEEETGELSVEEAEQIAQHVAAALPKLDALIASDYAKGVISPGLAQYVLAQCKAQGVLTFADPKPANIESFTGMDVIKPNYSEALRLAGREREATPDEMGDVCREILKRTEARNVVVTAGSRGMYVLADGDFEHIPGLKRDVYDVAGAGDTTLAAMALALAVGASLIDAARLGNVAGSIAVSKLGTAAVTAEELRKEVAAVYGGTKP